MRLILIFLIVIVQSCTSSMSQQNTHEANELINENSPYLLQHAYNPVHWFPWNDDALAKAKEENKLLIISIGYAACHWCHVMEHESFEDSTVAAVMNENFVSIKVDREERPDVDDVYMTACQLVSDRGCGWPLNAFALPDGRPVWAGTYFPKDQWLSLLDQFAQMWKETPDKLNEYAERLTSGVREQDIIDLAGEKPLKEADAHLMANGLLNRMDLNRGGREGAPKFPMPANLEYLLAYAQMSGNDRALDALTTTLDNMAAGGIYDQMGGGFARYSVDHKWLVPHFEKMLYDNGQLLSIYAQAYKYLKLPRYKEVVDETIAFLVREMRSEEGGFYASLDADSEGEEGKFYVWTIEQLNSLLDDNPNKTLLLDYYNISADGNWEHKKNIFHYEPNTDKFLKKHGLNSSEWTEVLGDFKNTVLTARSERIRPGLDDKILCSWNALTIKGLLDAYQATNNPEFLELANTALAFVEKYFLQSDYRLMRNAKDGKVKINGFLDDYATLIDAYLVHYESTFNTESLDKADKLASYAIDHFYNENSGIFYYTSDLDPALVARKSEINDNVIPASNSMMARNLHVLGSLLDNANYKSTSDQLLYNLLYVLEKGTSTSFYANWAHSYLEKVSSTYEIAIVGDQADNIRAQMQQHYFANSVFLGGIKEGDLPLLQDKSVAGSTRIYVCQNKVCQLPTEEVTKALELIKYSL